MATHLTVETTIFTSFSANIEKVASRATSFSIVRTFLLATLLAAPLAFGAVQAWAWAAMAVVVFLLFLFWSIGCVRQGRIRILWSPLYLPAAFIFVLGVIQFVGHLTMDSLATREALLKLSTDLILFFLAGQVFSAQVKPLHFLNDRELRGGGRRGEALETDSLSCHSLRWTLLLYTFLLALFAIFQFFTGEGLIY